MGPTVGNGDNVLLQPLGVCLCVPFVVANPLVIQFEHLTPAAELHDEVQLATTEVLDYLLPAPTWDMHMDMDMEQMKRTAVGIGLAVLGLGHAAVLVRFAPFSDSGSPGGGG